MKPEQSIQKAVQITKQPRTPKKIEYSRQKLLRDLTYGKNMRYFHPKLMQQREIVLYFHESNQQILQATDLFGQTWIFDIKRMIIIHSNYKLQQKYLLQPNLYLIIEDAQDCVILVFKSIEETNNFYQAARDLINVVHSLQSQVDSDIIKCFIQADTNRNFVIELDELITMMRRLKMNDAQQIREFFIIAREENKFQSMTFNNFQKIAKICMCRKQLLPIFQNYCQLKIESYNKFGEKIMSRQQFTTFLIQHQCQSKLASQIVSRKLFPTLNSKISFHQFCTYILGPSNSIQSLSYRQSPTPLGHPLTSYHCHSSHNTYLTGDQLNSDSRAERYFQDLLNSIRCVEIDTHDGSTGPIVKHGNTLTSAIGFEDVLAQIKRFCQISENHTPIIISIENHCGNKNQQIMAQMLIDAFGDKLVRIKDNKDRQSMTLGQLMGKIIIKCTGNMQVFKQTFSEQKNSKMYVNKTLECTVMRQNENESQDEQNQNQKPLIQPKLKQQAIFSLKTIKAITTPQKQKLPQQFQCFQNQFQLKINQLQKEKEQFFKLRLQMQVFVKKNFGEKKSTKVKKTINMKLLEVTSMLGSGSLGEPCYWESVSISQDKVLEYYHRDREKIRKHTNVGWIRSYPKNLRFDSSNFNPFPSLQMGIQIIALNTQINDFPTLLMRKFFQKGIEKTPGYRLKTLIDSDFSYDFDLKIKKLSITPISALKIYYNNISRKQQIPICQIRMRLYCCSVDFHLNTETTQWKYYTQAVRNNAYNPIFLQREAMIIYYTVQQLAFVAVDIQGAGTGIISIEGIKKGYRNVSLWDSQAQVKTSKIIFLVQEGQVN